MLHWIGWIGLVGFAITAVIIAVYTGIGAVGAARDGSGDVGFGFGLMIAIFASGACLFATAAAVVSAITAYNWTPW